MTHQQHPIGSPFGAAATADDVLTGVDLAGKHVVVTGGHAGLGLETTRALAKAGASVTVGSRDPDRAAHVLIGDFSRMTHLSVKALRHYHDVGLLAPAEIDADSGYRYYASSQVATAPIIRRFRALDMPVDEVRGVLATPDRPRAAS